MGPNIFFYSGQLLLLLWFCPVAMVALLFLRLEPWFGETQEKPSFSWLVVARRWWKSEEAA
jgi:hypothetical protein